MIMLNVNRQCFLLSLLLFMLLLSACAGHKVRSNVNGPEGAAAAEGDSAGPPVNKSEVSSQEIQQNQGHAYKSEFGEINLKSNSLVENWIGYFQGRGRHWMELYLSRSTRYMPMMKNTLREYGLPEDLVYVAMIESGFSPVAHSRAAAVGYWQFMRSTARTYGLTVNQYIDERRDPVLSTRAAADYFKALYNLFGSWHLALASYNSGENRVKAVVMRNYTRDFWELVRLRKIPPETQNYVPKFIAAAMIAKDPIRYGFKDIVYEKNLSYDTVNVLQPISLKKLATNLAVDYEELVLLNPKYRSEYVPVDANSETILRVPTGMKDRALASLENSVSGAPRMLLSENEFYRVRRGDSLSTIAAHHRTSVATLQRLNNFRPHQLLRIGQKIRIPETYSSTVTDRLAERRQPSAEMETPASEATPAVHLVKRGENLSTIARHYNMTVGEIRRLNKLSRRSVIHAGDRLLIRQPTEKVQINNSSLRSQKLVKHVVKKGETLTVIARKYKVSLARLLAVNDLGNRQRLLAGTALVIP